MSHVGTGPPSPTAASARSLYRQGHPSSPSLACNELDGLSLGQVGGSPGTTSAPGGAISPPFAPPSPQVPGEVPGGAVWAGLPGDLRLCQWGPVLPRGRGLPVRSRLPGQPLRGAAVPTWPLWPPLPEPLPLPPPAQPEVGPPPSHPGSAPAPLPRPCTITSPSTPTFPPSTLASPQHPHLPSAPSLSKLGCWLGGQEEVKPPLGQVLCAPLPFAKLLPSTPSAPYWEHWGAERVPPQLPPIAWGVRLPPWLGRALLQRKLPRRFLRGRLPADLPLPPWGDL